jgi:hypothetical protein
MSQVVLAYSICRILLYGSGTSDRLRGSDCLPLEQKRSEDGESHLGRKVSKHMLGVTAHEFTHML